MKNQLAAQLLQNLTQIPNTVGEGPDKAPPMPVEVFDGLIGQIRQQLLWMEYLTTETLEEQGDRLKAERQRKAAQANPTSAPASSG